LTERPLWRAKEGVGGVGGKGGIGEDGGESTLRVATVGTKDKIALGWVGGAPDDEVTGGGVGLASISMIFERGVVTKE
jgi:hypothetical protein